MMKADRIDTLILQLGHILRSVQTWRRVYTLRVIVFVEYAAEVEEETARVRALLEKLRIDAEVLVFYLASGSLNTYELIVNGSTSDIDTEIIVSDALRDEDWWDELQAFRGQTGNLSSSQEFTQIVQILDSTAGRPGVYNPHEEGVGRRQSVAEVADMPKRPDLGILSKMGVSMGIHTTHINDGVLQDAESESESEYDTEYDSDAGPAIVDEELGVLGTLPTPFMESGSSDSVSQPLLGRPQGSSPTKKRGRQAESSGSYGTLAASGAAQPAMQQIPDVKTTVVSPPNNTTSPPEAFPILGPLQVPEFPSGSSRRSRSASPGRDGQHTPREGEATPARPNFSRQSSAARFSSRPVPETKITSEGEGGSKITFAADSTPTTPRVERPAFSRHSSLGKFSSRPVPETRVSVGDEGAARTISFAEQPHYASRHHSRQGSQYSTAASFSATEYDEDETPTAGVSLSFNDLPSRAQHLILNELMRQHSDDTAVLMTTLPIPSEGTSHDEAATVQYLSDVELLCAELPPTLMVLSNNMTVTVSL